jgi:hypothetical protein
MDIGIRADELGTNETPNVMTIGVEKYDLGVRLLGNERAHIKLAAKV